jgi:hypothetical protein
MTFDGVAFALSRTVGLWTAYLFDGRCAPRVEIGSAIS